VRNKSRKFKLNNILIQEWNHDKKDVILYIHGFPGCADQAQLLTDSPLIHQFRLMAIDRPGYGSSTFQPQLTPVKLAKQLKEILDVLDINKIRLLSVSGGAPYTFALADLLQKKVLKISSVGGIAPLEKNNFKHMNVQQKKAYLMSRMVPTPAARILMNRYWKKGIDEIDKLVFTGFKNFSEPDRAAFLHPEVAPVLIETLKIALKQGPQGVLHDMKTFSKNWGFNLDEIKCPVTLWHGDSDDVVNVEFAFELKRKLPQAVLKVKKGEGHYSIAMNYRDQILSDLLKS
jgi:pimeloyl-ACP methyl ester carboxylesterase